MELYLNFDEHEVVGSVTNLIVLFDDSVLLGDRMWLQR